MSLTHDELKTLADDIEKRGLKFADMPPGQYEMPSEDEHKAICLALRQSEEIEQLRSRVGDAEEALEMWDHLGGCKWYWKKYPVNA